MTSLKQLSGTGQVKWRIGRCRVVNCMLAFSLSWSLHFDWPDVMEAIRVGTVRGTFFKGCFSSPNLAGHSFRLNDENFGCATHSVFKIRMKYNIISKTRTSSDFLKVTCKHL